jgi:hypothetical protein
MTDDVFEMVESLEIPELAFGSEDGSLYECKVE